MLKRLQRNFMIITMTLLAIVMFGTLAISYTTTQQSLDRFVFASLDRVLDVNTPTRPLIGVLATGSEDVESSFGHMAVFWIDILESSSEPTTNDSAAIIGPRALSAVMNAISSTDEESGVLPQFDIVWKRGPIPGGERVAVANTTGVETALEVQMHTNVAIGCACLAVLFAVMWVLCKWMLRPVEMAWEAQRRFTADASHELKTPLAVILANNKVLQGDKANFPEKDRRWIDSTGEEAERMHGLVTGLLELSKADEGKFTENIYHMEPLDFSALVEGMTLQFDVVAFEAGISVNERIEPHLTVMGDEGELEKVVKILLDNAVKYSNQGRDVDVTVEQVRGKSARLAVSNWGDALTEEDVTHIFDRFYRSDKARSRETGGFGLGLPIAHAIIENLGGEITCESTEMGETTFTIVLPLAKEG